MKKNNKGFTLAELLIVVAIIAVLVAIAIPVFTSQLEKAREATDAANIRSAYAEMLVTAIDDTSGTIADKVVNLKQTQGGWQSEVELPSNITISGEPSSKGTATLSYTGATYTPASGSTPASSTEPVITVTFGS